MSLAVAVVVLLILAIFHDILYTWYVGSLNNNTRLKAALLAGALTAFGWVSYLLVIRLGGADGTVCGILASSVGSAAGTYYMLGKDKKK